MRRLARFSLVCLAFSCLAASSANASVTHDGWGLGVADDTHFTTPLPSWGPWFERLRPKVYRMQMRWDSDATQINNAKQRIFYAKYYGVQQVTVTFKVEGTLPTPVVYGQKIAAIVKDMAGIVDAWGPVNEPTLHGINPYTLAAYWQQFLFIVRATDPTAVATSPDFQDHYNLSGLDANYLDLYVRNGGGWGDVAAFHPYWGVHFNSTATVSNYSTFLPAGTPIWLTEVGAFGKNSSHGISDPENLQAARASWLVNAMGSMIRVSRIYYYSMGAGGSDFDTGLLNVLGAPRPAWEVWCAYTHNTSGHPDCAH
jgi:hypothetical protein